MKELNIQLQAQFNKMCATGKLFRADISTETVWELYLGGFGKRNDPVFRDPESSMHNCNHCNNFIRRYGNVVALDSTDMSIMTIFDVNCSDEYQNSMDMMSSVISAAKIKNVFFETFNSLNSLPYESCKKNADEFKLGVDSNPKRYTKEEAEKYGVVKPEEIRIFNHFSLQLPKAFVDKSGKSVESIMGGYRDAKNVFQRAMEEIPADTLELVRDLIKQGSLLNGDTHLYKVESILSRKKAYDRAKEFSPSVLDNWCWDRSYGYELAKFKNELIGVLCSELAEGEELNKACQSWNKRVDPANYMKAVAPITETQKRNAQKFVEENDYVESFDRRHAVLDDIKADEIKHMNVGDGDIQSVSIFDNVKATKSRHKRNEFEGVEEVSIEKFMKDILPGCTSVEAFLENRHEGNMVTMTTSNFEDCKQMFKWNNPYSWTYKGNLAGKSQIKEAVKSRGGNTVGVLNVRIAFPGTEKDYDLHIFEPKGGHIYYNNVRKIQRSSGMLDLDAQGIDGHQPPEKRVENIIYTDKSKMPIGTYSVRVADYSNSYFPADCNIEVEIDGEVSSFLIEGGKHSPNNVSVCDIDFDGSNFKVSPRERVKLVSSNSISKEIYGLETKNFHKVNLMCLSPNHWGDNSTGNKHYFFMLDKCKTDSSIRSFHSENLLPDLAQHRKVLESLALTTMLNTTDNQLSGLGFNATVSDYLILRLKGNFKRTIKLKI